MKTIMIIDDDIHISNAVTEMLTNAGYCVTRAYSGTEAVFALTQSKPDLVLLDLMLPGLSGEEVLPLIGDIPVIVMSARADIDTKVELLMSGAADYVTKPFHSKELLARISAQLRAHSGKENNGILQFGEITLDTSTHLVTIGDTEIRLTRTEYAILKILIQNQTQIASKSKILDTICDDTPDCTESSLKTHISHLRSKLSEVSGQDHIETIWGIGFRMK